MLSREEFSVSGSYGIIFVDKTSGEVISYIPYRAHEDLYKYITRFDVDEFISVHKEKAFDYQIDILDIGYWENGQYEPPSQDYRSSHNSQVEEIKQNVDSIW